MRAYSRAVRLLHINGVLIRQGLDEILLTTPLLRRRKLTTLNPRRLLTTRLSRKLKTKPLGRGRRMKLATSRASSRHIELARFVSGDIWLGPVPLAIQCPRPTMGRGFVVRSSARRSSVPEIEIVISSPALSR